MQHIVPFFANVATHKTPQIYGNYTLDITGTCTKILMRIDCNI